MDEVVFRAVPLPHLPPVRVVGLLTVGGAAAAGFLASHFSVGSSPSLLLAEAVPLSEFDAEKSSPAGLRAHPVLRPKDSLSLVLRRTPLASAGEPEVTLLAVVEPL